MSNSVLAQPKGFNYDESKVPIFELPKLLVTEGGQEIRSVQGWLETRRPEILGLFEDHVYGKTPAVEFEVQSRVTENDALCFQGTAVRKQIVLTLKRDSRTLELNLLAYRPVGKNNCPTFVGLNFLGNHTVAQHSEIRLPDPERQKPGSASRDFEKERGAKSSRWPVKEIVNRGYAVVTMHCADVDPDFDDGFKNGVHLLVDGNRVRTGSDWGTIGGWAWGLSRVMDYLETDGAFDSKRVAVLGHSRLGKTSLWAGAQDERFAIVISNNSGCGGAALSRRRFGETVKRINTVFPHWFCTKFKDYNDKEDLLPVDQHMLIALIAPRAVYVASATGDLWADPKGEFLAASNAQPAFKLFGKPVSLESSPKPGRRVGGHVSYHVRQGKHDITHSDWSHYMDFANEVFALEK